MSLAVAPSDGPAVNVHIVAAIAISCAALGLSIAALSLALVAVQR